MSQKDFAWPACNLLMKRELFDIATNDVGEQLAALSIVATALMNSELLKASGKLAMFQAASPRTQ